jgi:hypothetical protein
MGKARFIPESPGNAIGILRLARVAGLPDGSSSIPVLHVAMDEATLPISPVARAQIVVIEHARNR